MVEDASKLSRTVDVIRWNLEKFLIVLSGIAILVSGYVTIDYKSNVDCHVQLLEADRKFTNDFAAAMVILLAQPPRPVEERRRAFELVRTSLVEKQRLQAELGSCQ